MMRPTILIILNNIEKHKLKNMKKLKYYIGVFVLLSALIYGCQDDDNSIGDIVAPNNVTITAEVLGADATNPNGDGSGFVNIKATADNVISYKFDFGDGLSEVVPSGEVKHRFSVVGTNTFTIVVNAIGTGGLSTSTSINVDVFSSFDDPRTTQFLTGGSTRTWYLAAAEVAHLGVGPARPGIDGDWWYPKWYGAQPFEKCSDPASACFCDDEFTFSIDSNGQITYQQDNKGATFFNGAHSAVAGGPGSGDDACYEWDTSGTSIVSLAPSDGVVPEAETTGTQLNFSDGAFMGYYVSSSSYEVLEITNTTLYVRVYDGLNDALAWYLKFSTSPADDVFETQYTELVWFDEFDVDGAPNPTNWGYDLGDGGWGNGELQNYTNSLNNSIVENGVLKIIALAEGSGYTSARLKSEGLYEFTYGRVEVRAKLPAAQGTWPAIWMLGANFQTVGWPTCGEIDIMEQRGQLVDKDEVSAALHLPGNSGGGAITELTGVSNASTEFHNYSVEWAPQFIKVLLDDKVYFTFANTGDTPFNNDFFLILNVAMGGSLGGEIDPTFTQDTMEIDYVRVYQ